MLSEKDIQCKQKLITRQIRDKSDENVKIH